MKFTLHILFIAFLVALAYAGAAQKAVVVSYPKDTPDSVVEKAKAAIKEAVRFMSRPSIKFYTNKAIRAESSPTSTTSSRHSQPLLLQRSLTAFKPGAPSTMLLLKRTRWFQPMERATSNDMNIWGQAHERVTRSHDKQRAS